MLKKVRIHMKTSRKEAHDSLFEQSFHQPPGADRLAQEPPEELEMTVDGVLREDATHVYLSYKEGELTEMGDTTTTISYQKDMPKLVSITRNGTVRSTLVFEEGTQQRSVYETPYMPFEVATYTTLIKNSLLTDGHLRMRYIVEIKGANAERTNMTLTLLPYFKEPIGKC